MNSSSGIADDNSLETQLGDQAPLLSGSGTRPPDRRRVSVRWLTGSVLTGVTSVLLMGGALYAALDGRQQLARPASILDKLNGTPGNDRTEAAVKGDRPTALIALKPASERILQVPTVTRVGDANVIRKRPFAYASAPLAIAPNRLASYPKFNPLTIFSASGKTEEIAASSDAIYGADIESEVTMRRIAFDLEAAQYDKDTEISTMEAEAIVHAARTSLADGDIAVAALPYLDATRFVLKQEEVEPASGLDIRIVAENVSTTEQTGEIDLARQTFGEEIISIVEAQSFETALKSMKLEQNSLDGILTALKGELGTKKLKKGTKLRVAWEQNNDVDAQRLPRRVSVYRGGNHIISVAINDKGAVVWANEPALIPAVSDDGKGDEIISMVATSNLPNIYDGLYRAAMSQGLTKSHARRITRTVAFDVDFRAVIKPDDDLEVFYSIEEGQEGATDESEILYIGLTLNGLKRRYYRFRAADDGTVDYYDETGKSAKKFLLRKPVPNGTFRSPFGPRRHPISRVVKMHAGVDFSAPRGTPIIAAGNGIVEKAGWGGGCGKRTILRHSNGYKTIYCHQNRIAKGVKAGARVRQGQIIGQVGSTGYSTGPHLHYEVVVNGRKVDPMRIRLPKGRVLRGEVLEAFRKERDRIDTLLEKGRAGEQKFASLN